MHLSDSISDHAFLGCDEELTTTRASITQSAVRGVMAADTVTDGIHIIQPHKRTTKVKVVSTRYTVRPVRLSEQGENLVVGSDHGLVYIYSTSTGALLQTLRHSTNRVLVRTIEVSLLWVYLRIVLITSIKLGKRGDDFLIASAASEVEYFVRIWKSDVSR